MQINVLAELRQPVGSVTTTEIDEGCIKIDGLEVGALSGTARMLRTDLGLLVTVVAEGVARETCARCLADTRCPLTFAFEEEYVALVDPNTGVRARDYMEGDSFTVSGNFILDLREGIRQYLLMSEPAKPLCRPECAGLCPTCGADLNLGTCDCARELDDRWRALAAATIQERGGSN